MRKSGVEFLHVPDTYYDDLLARVGQIDEDIQPLRDLNILVVSGRLFH
jgi:4-hydroxyphenylpyruvate dioxygenase